MGDPLNSPSVLSDIKTVWLAPSPTCESRVRELT